jgi:hypothetical protein
VSFERLAWRPDRTAHRADCFPECSGTEPSSKRPPERTFERRRLLRDHRRQAKRQVRDVGKDAEPLGAGEQIGHQHPRLEKAPLVRVVLDADQIQPERIGADGELARLSYLGRVRNQTQAELDRP